MKKLAIVLVAVLALWAARDSGLLLHCNGKPQGATWEASIEANVMEGDTGSFWLVGNRKGSDGVDDEGRAIKLGITVEAEKRSNGEVNRSVVGLIFEGD